MSLGLRKRYLMSLQQASAPSGRLPSGYQEVEYIAVNNTFTYINTLVRPNRYTSYEIDFQQTDTRDNQNLWGSYNNGFVCQTTTYQNKVYAQFVNTDTISNVLNFSTDLNRHTIKTTFGAQYLDGVLMSTQTPTSTSTTNRPFTLFNRYMWTIDAVDTNSSRYPSMKLYSCKLWDNDTLVRNFIPCYRTADNEIGMYDLVNDVFYTNQGSGSFTKGADINVPAHDSVLENNTWAIIKAVIDSGYKPNYWLGQTKEILSGTYAGYHLQLVDLQTNRYQKSDNSGYTNAVFQLVEITYNTYKMNTTANNNGGYASSYMKSTTMPAIYSNLPNDIQAIITECEVLSGIGNNTTTGTSSSSVKLFLPCEYEMSGVKENSIGSSEGSPQYQWWAQKTQSDRIKYTFGTSTAGGYWLRSPVSARDMRFCFIATLGNNNYNIANENIAVAFAFAI